MVLLLATSALAQVEDVTETAGSAKDYLLALNPLILIAAGVILFFASKFAKIIGILLIIIGAIVFALPYV